MKNYKKKFFGTLIFLLIVNLSFSQTNKTEKETSEDIRREKVVEKIEQVLKLNIKDIQRRSDKNFNMKIIRRGLFLIKSANANFLKTITYNNLLIFVRGLMILEKENPPIGVLTKGAQYDYIIQSLIGGLQNKDPRIRLFTIQTLKSLTPSIELFKKIILISKDETDIGRSYYYFDIDFNVHIGNLKIEMILLEKILRRKNLIKLLNNKNKSHPSLFIIFSRSTFEVLADRIANEPEKDIPLNNFGEDRINYLIAGLLNKNAYVKERCAEYIYKIYYQKGTSYKTQKRIEELRGGAFTFEKEVLKENYRMQFLLHKKMYPMLAVEGSFVLKTVFLRKEQEKE